MSQLWFDRSVACFALTLALLSIAALAGGVPAVELDTIEVIAKKPLQDSARAATEGYVTEEQLAQRPISRAGELLEFVPGLIVTQHSGEGKANQWFLRGFNLDHGTDFYTEVDGMPVNMRSHGHGQGYADLNFIIPELISALEYRKGPYFADVGDFAAAGSADLRYVDQLPRALAKASLGEDGYASALLAGSPAVAGGKLLLGGEVTQYDGAYELEQDVKKFKGIARYNRGDAGDGFTIGLAAYDIEYDAPDQIPLRAVRNGTIDELGFIDATDGGDVHRYSLHGEWRAPARHGNWRAQAYALDYRMQLFSNFTYFLSDPGDTDALPDDQFEQFDERKVYGINARRYWLLPIVLPVDFELGVQARHDDIDQVGLYLTQARQRQSTVREDGIKESSIGIYLSSTQRWNAWFRSETGLRVDTYDFEVNSDLAANSGDADDDIVSPKLALIFGPWSKTELYLNYGEGFHSNDARGTTNTIDPIDGVTPIDPVTPLAKARGAEVGVNTRIVPNTVLSVSMWTLDLESELIYVGDAGNNEPSAASDRRGVEVSAYWTPLPWLIVDADYAYSHARLDVDGNENRIPNSLDDVYSLGITIPETKTGVRACACAISAKGR